MSKLTMPEHWLKGMREHIPERMIPGLVRYIEDGIMPGDFLQAVLRNDLKEACAMADDENQALIWDYAYVLYNYAPSDCWGSPERVQRWIEARSNNGGTDETPT